MIKNIVKDVDIVHLMTHWTFLNALVYFVVRRLQKPYVICPVGTLPLYYRSKFMKKLYNWIIGKKIIRNASRCIAVTAEEIAQFQAYGVDADKIFVIPNGINPEDFQRCDAIDFKRKYGLTDCPFIMFMGRLSYIKGPDILLRAFCRIKDKYQDYHMVFVGPNEGMLSELRDIVADFGVEEKVHFLGYLGSIDKAQAYYACELLVIPSRQEAMSIVVLEAGITGTPVLITEQCGFNEIANLGGGQVVPPSVDGIQKGLMEMLGDPAKLKSMGQNLKEHINNYFNWNVIIDKYVKLYNAILK